jgi:hypothetical protein
MSPYLAKFISSAVKAKYNSSRGKSSVRCRLCHLGDEDLQKAGRVTLILLLFGLPYFN